MNAKKKAAATVLHTAPLPPAIDVPPTITAVRTENTKLKSSDGCAEIALMSSQFQQAQKHLQAK